MINIAGFDHAGVPFSAQYVQLVQEGDEFPYGGHYCEWMPYQKGQAAVAEQTEQQLDMPGDFRSRMLVEHAQLRQRIEKLAEFILSKKFMQLLEVERDDLLAQMNAMEKYFAVLNRRLSRHCNEA